MKRFLMPATALAVMKRVAFATLCCALLLVLNLPVQAGEWKVGHVVVAIPGGNIEVIDPNNPATPVDASVTLGISGRVGGCAPDSSYRIRCVGYGDGDVVKLALQHPHAPTSTLSVSGNPQSILHVGSNNDFIVGFAGGLVKRYGYAVTTDSPTKTCGPVATDASSTFWMDIFSNQSTIVYTSGVGNGSKATLRKFNMTTTSCGAVSNVFPSLKLASGQAFYGLRALPNTGSQTVDGTAGYIIALGSDILRVSGSGSPNRCYVSGTVAAVCPTSFTGVDGANNNWRALWLTPDGNAFWTVNLATGHLFEFKIADGTVQAGPITTAAGSSDDVGGITVEGADDAAQPPVQTKTVSLDAPGGSSQTGFATFFDVPACCSTIPPNKVTITLNAGSTEITDTFTIRFNEVAPVVGKSDTGLDCAIESQDHTKCVIWEIEEAVTGTGGTEDLLFFGPQSPPAGTSPTLLQNLSTDVVSLVAVDEIITKKTTSCTTCHSVYTQNLLQLAGGTAVFHSGGWLSPITDTAGNSFKGGSVTAKFINLDSNGNPVSTGSFGCSATTLNNCPELFVTQLTADHLTDITNPDNTGGSGTAPFVFREGGDGITWVVTVNSNTVQAGCYIFTGKDPLARFAPFSYSSTTNPLTTIIRIGTSGTIPSAATCNGFATNLGLVVH